MFKFHSHPPPWERNVSGSEKTKLTLDPKPGKTITTIGPPPPNPYQCHFVVMGILGKNYTAFLKILYIPNTFEMHSQ